MLDRSRALRHDATDAERRLWGALRGARLDGRRFRRQVPIGPYIADFVCPAAKLIVEVDGSQHAEAANYDARRTAFLDAEGYRVLRAWNIDVLTNLNAVLDTIYAALTSPHPGPPDHPSPQRERGPGDKNRANPIPSPPGEREVARSAGVTQSPLPPGRGVVRRTGVRGTR